MRANRSILSNNRRAFTLVEMLVAIAISIVITLGLYAVFNQIQTAFQKTIAQVDVLEGGRATMDLVGSELEELGASGVSQAPNLFSLTEPQIVSRGDRRRVFRDFFFLTRQGSRWRGIGYWIKGGDDGVGTLQRFVPPNTEIRTLQSRAPINQMIQAFNSAGRRERSHPVIDGVIHFNIVPLDSEGIPWFDRINQEQNARTQEPVQIMMRPSADSPQDPLFAFYNKAIPAYVDLELAILEKQALEQFREMPNPTTKQEFLKRQTGKIHVFRERIPIRTAPTRIADNDGE